MLARNKHDTDKESKFLCMLLSRELNTRENVRATAIGGYAAFWYAVCPRWASMRDTGLGWWGIGVNRTSRISVYGAKVMAAEAD